MTDTKLLRLKIAESGYKMKFLASKLGITYQGFLNKVDNKREFTASEIALLSEILNLTKKERDDIFLHRK